MTPVHNKHDSTAPHNYLCDNGYEYHCDTSRVQHGRSHVITQLEKAVTVIFEPKRGVLPGAAAVSVSV